MREDGSLQKTGKRLSAPVTERTHFPARGEISAALRKGKNFEICAVNRHFLPRRLERNPRFGKRIDALHTGHRNFLALLDRKDTLIFHALTVCARPQK